MQRLKEAAEKAKIELSSVQETRSTCRSSPPTPRARKHLDLKLTRAKFHEITADLVDRCRVRSTRPSRTRAVQVRDRPRRALVGGSTRMPRRCRTWSRS
jgi:molecular chaperone DnaK